MPWKDILEGVKKSLGIKEKEKPSPFKFSPEKATAEARKMPDVVWEYIKQKRKELVEPAKPTPPPMFEPIKPLPTPRFETFVPTPAAPIPCGGTCAAGRRFGEEMAITPEVLTPLDIGRDIGAKEPESWYGTQSMKIKEWTEEVAKKEAKEKEKLQQSGLPWDQAQQELPWQIEEKAMKEHLAVVQSLKDVEKRLAENQKAMREGLPWETPYSERVKGKVSLATVVDRAKEELQRARWSKEKEAKEHGRQPDEDLNTDEEEILEKLLDAIADHHDTKYEPMREAIRKLPLSTSEKTYLGGQFQENYEADYDTLTPARKKEMVALAEQIWKNNKGNYYKASEELEGIRDRLQIDTVEFAAADEKLDEIDEAVKTERTTQLEKERKEMARRAATEYRVKGMTLNQLAEQLLKAFKSADDAEEQLEQFKLTEKEHDYVYGKLRDLEVHKLNKAFEVADEAAAEADEGYHGLLRRIWENDELTEAQKESIEEDIREDMSYAVQQEFDFLEDTTWEHKKHQIEKKRDADELDEFVAEEMLDIIDSERDEEEGMLEEAGLTGLSTEARLKKIDAAQIPKQMKEQLEAMVESIAEREERAKVEIEKEQREEKLMKGELHEKRPEGYILHFIPKEKEQKQKKGERTRQGKLYEE